MQTLAGSDAQKLALHQEQTDMLDMISLRFDENREYHVGDYALYFNGQYDALYRFKNVKAPSAWMPSLVQQVSLTDILNHYDSDIRNNSTEIASLTTKVESKSISLDSSFIYRGSIYAFGKVGVLYCNGPSNLKSKDTVSIPLPEGYETLQNITCDFHPPATDSDTIRVSIVVKTQTVDMYYYGSNEGIRLNCHVMIPYIMK